MSAEWFAKLKEFDSLGKMRLTSEQRMKEEALRLSRLEERRAEAEAELTALKAEYRELQQSYHEVEKKMASCEEQASRLRDIGGDPEKVKKLLLDAAELENTLFAKLERTDCVLALIEEKKGFLTGLEKTYLEIKAEVDQENAAELRNLEQLQLRMKLIEEELPTDIRSTLERTLKKGLAVGPFTRIESGSCYFCRYKISRTDESEIDMQKLLRTCPQCSRIFLPYGS